jgi:hypothetical protein
MADSDLYLDPSAGSPDLISIGDQCYRLAGPSPTAPDTFGFDASHSDCLDCSTATCPPSTTTYLAGSYKELMDPCKGNNGETVAGTDGALMLSASFDVDHTTPCYGYHSTMGMGCWNPHTNEGNITGSIVGGSARITTDFSGGTVRKIYFYDTDGVTVVAQWQRI